MWLAFTWWYRLLKVKFKDSDCFKFKPKSHQAKVHAEWRFNSKTVNYVFSSYEARIKRELIQRQWLLLILWGFGGRVIQLFLSCCTLSCTASKTFSYIQSNTRLVTALNCHAFDYYFNGLNVRRVETIYYFESIICFVIIVWLFLSGSFMYLCNVLHVNYVSVL